MIPSRQKPPIAFRLQALAIALVPVLTLAQTSVPVPDVSPATIDYQRDISPILKARCFECHGGTNQEGGLRLDRYDRAMLGGDNGRVIMPNNATNSELIGRIMSAEADDRMPPESGRN